MKNSKILGTLSFKVRHQSLLVFDQSRDSKLFFTTPIFYFVSSLIPFVTFFPFSSKTSYLNSIKKTYMLGKEYNPKMNTEAQDYRLLSLRFCMLFDRKQTTYKMIRPLLDFKRESITMICKDLLISVYPDKSNRLLQYSRNRIRKQIIPSIKFFINPQVENSLFKIAELLKKEQSITCSLLKTNLKNRHL